MSSPRINAPAGSRPRERLAMALKGGVRGWVFSQAFAVPGWRVRGGANVLPVWAPVLWAASAGTSTGGEVGEERGPHKLAVVVPLRGCDQHLQQLLQQLAPTCCSRAGSLTSSS
jgi:hypothetical protein